MRLPLAPSAPQERLTSAPCCSSVYVRQEDYSDELGTQELSDEDLVVPAIGHAWGEWRVVKEPTATETGENQRVCANDSSHVEIAIIPATGVEVPDPNADEPTVVFADAYETGDPKAGGGETPHYADILWLAEQGISTGWTHETDPDNVPEGEAQFRPYQSTARADMAAFLHRMAEAGLVPEVTEP